MRYLKFALLSILVIGTLWVSPVLGQSVETRCGDIVEASFTEPESFVTFTLEMSAGDTFYIETERFGSYLMFNIVLNQNEGTAIFAPSGSVIVTARGELFNFNDSFLDNIRLQTETLGETGEYTIRLRNNDANGAFLLKVGCTLRNGTVVEPGDAAPADDGSNADSNVQPESTFSGYGFPGLAAVDFSNAFRTSLTVGTMSDGEIPPGSSNVFGYRFNGEANQRFTVNVQRTSGNLNLGVTVLSENNEVVFFSILVNGNAVTGDFSLPNAGEYTVGVFTLELLPPDSPQATAFQVQVVGE